MSVGREGRAKWEGNIRGSLNKAPLFIIPRVGSFSLVIVDRSIHLFWNNYANGISFFLEYAHGRGYFINLQDLYPCIFLNLET